MGSEWKLTEKDVDFVCDALRTRLLRAIEAGKPIQVDFRQGEREVAPDGMYRCFELDGSVTILVHVPPDPVQDVGERMVEIGRALSQRITPPEGA